MTPPKKRLQGKPDCEQEHQMLILEVVLFSHLKDKHAA